MPDTHTLYAITHSLYSGRARSYLIKQGITVEIEGEDTPALVAEWLSMVITA